VKKEGGREGRKEGGSHNFFGTVYINHFGLCKPASENQSGFHKPFRKNCVPKRGKGGRKEGGRKEGRKEGSKEGRKDG
jgi:hypothetical protein